MTELAVHIPIPDWEEECLRKELCPQSIEEIGEELQRGHTTAELARAIIARRLRGECPADLIQPDKPLLMTGAAKDVAARVMAIRKTVRLTNGRDISVRALIAPVQEDEADEDGNAQDVDTEYVTWASKWAVERAVTFLHKRVVGYVVGRLEIIAANKGDVRGEAQKFVEEVWKVVEGLE